MLCIGVALVPVALTLRHGASDVLRTAPTGGAAAVPVIAGQASSTVAMAATTAAPLVELAPATTEFDIDALPPATPVNDVGETPTSAAPPTSAAAKVAVATAPATAASTPATSATEAPKAEAPTTAPVCSSTYRIVSGDAWILIADKVGVTTKQLLAANGATTSTPLYPGRDICLPKGAATTTTVKPPTTTAPKATPTTVKPVATTAAPTTTLPKRTYTAAEVEAIIREVWPDDLEDEAVRIARRESNLQPTARNFCCYGLFQIYYSVHKGWLSGIGVTSADQLFDPRVNAVAGYTLYQRSGGWGPWAL